MAKPESSHPNTDHRRGSFNPAWNPVEEQADGSPAHGCADDAN
jgi:hypothetical protein